MSAFCVKNQSQVVADTSLLYVYILPEAREKEMFRKVEGNYKKHLHWFVFVTRLHSVPESVRNASSDTLRKSNLNLTCRHLS